MNARQGYAALYEEDATEEEQIECYQRLVNSGDAWRLEGSVGRAAMRLIEAGQVMLGQEGHRDYWGNYVPSRSEVKEGTKGSFEYVAERTSRKQAHKLARIT